MISKYNKRNSIFLCVNDSYSKHAWVVLLKSKAVITMTKTFQKILDGSNRHIAKSKGCKPYKISVGKVVNFTIDQENHGYKKTINKCILHKVY